MATSDQFAAVLQERGYSFVRRSNDKTRTWFRRGQRSFCIDDLAGGISVTEFWLGGPTKIGVKTFRTVPHLTLWLHVHHDCFLCR